MEDEGGKGRGRNNGKRREEGKDKGIEEEGSERKRG